MASPKCRVARPVGRISSVMRVDPETAEVERFKLYSVKELLKLCDPAWLIKGLFRVGAFVVLYGPPGDGKTFLALDWALSIARGCQWNGRATKRGTVVYVAAEGGRSIRKRVAAWLKCHKLKNLRHAFFLLEAVQVREAEDLELVKERIDDLRLEPTLIVVDTLARCFVGGHENSADDMGEFVYAVADLQQETGAAVMVLHHTPRNDPNYERGSGSLRAAVDAMIRVRKTNGGVLTVSNNKQKDDEEFDDMTLQLRQVSLGHDEDGEPVSSCVLDTAASAESTASPIDQGCLKTLAALATFPKGEASTSAWQQKASRKQRTLHDHRKKLKHHGLVEEVGRGRYRVTEEGRRLAKTATAT